MNEKFNKNAKVEQLTKMCLSREEEKALSLKILLVIEQIQGIAVTDYILINALLVFQ